MKETIEKTNSHQINHTKEVKWLNEMADEQKALVEAVMWKYKTDYIFESCSAGEYTFHIEFHPGTTSSDCIAFMEGNGAELISDLPLGVRKNSMHKLYFRKHIDNGGFNQYYDSNPIIKYLRKYQIVLVVPILAIVLMTLLFIFLFPEDKTSNMVMVIISLIFVIVGTGLFRWYEKAIREIKAKSSYK